MVAGYSCLDAIVSVIGKIKSLAKELFPTVFAIRCGWIGAIFSAIWVVRVELIVLGVHAGRRGVENPAHVLHLAGVQHIQIDRCGVMHDIGIMLSGEYIAGAAHVRSELIDLVESAVDNLTASVGVPQISDHEVIGLRFGKWIYFEIDSADPETFALEALYQVSTDKAARA
jgi:hypothetical protein